MTITPNSSPPVLEEEMKMGSSRNRPVLAPESAISSAVAPMEDARTFPDHPLEGHVCFIEAALSTYDDTISQDDVRTAWSAIKTALRDGAARVHEQVSPPIRADLENPSLEDRAALREEVERLHTRLEDNFAWCNGERVSVEPGSIPDGIECRDETIRQQRERITELFERARAAEEALKAVNRMSLVIESAVRNADPTNHADTIAALRLVWANEGARLTPTPATKDDSHEA